MKDARDLYIDLMKRCLTNWIYGDAEVGIWSPKKNPLKKRIAGFLKRQGLRIVRPQPMQAARRMTGLPWPIR